MIKERVFDADVNQILVQPNRDRGLLRAIGNALWERPSVRTPPQTRGQFADMIEATPDFVFTADIGIGFVDPEKRVGYANPKAARLLGYPAEELIGMPMVNLICHEASANERDHSEVTGRGERASHTVRLRRKDGAVVSARASTTPLFDEQEQLIGILALVAEAVEERSEKANPSRKSEGFLFVARKLRSGLPETCTCLWSILSLE